MKITASLLFLIFLLLTILAFIWLSGNTTQNFLYSKYIDTGVGWINDRSRYAGSEMHFIFTNSAFITVRASANSKADQGIELFIDNKSNLFPLSINNSSTFTMKVDKRVLHTVTIRHFCTYLYYPCGVTLQGIILNSNARLIPYKQHIKILSILGDSISTMFGIDNYSQITADALQYELHNASIMGSTVTKVPGLDSASMRYKNDLMNFKSDAIIIFLGTNDVGAHVQLDTFEKDYTNIVTSIKAYNAHSKLFLVGILPRKDIGYSNISPYNDIIKSVALLENANYIDMSQVLTPEEFADSIHPSQEGQKKIADFLKNELTPFLR